MIMYTLLLPFSLTIYSYILRGKGVKSIYSISIKDLESPHTVTPQVFKRGRLQQHQIVNILDT